MLSVAETEMELLRNVRSSSRCDSSKLRPVPNYQW